MPPSPRPEGGESGGEVSAALTALANASGSLTADELYEDSVESESVMAVKVKPDKRVSELSLELPLDHETVPNVFYQSALPIDVAIVPLSKYEEALRNSGRELLHVHVLALAHRKW